MSFENLLVKGQIVRIAPAGHYNKRVGWEGKDSQFILFKKRKINVIRATQTINVIPRKSTNFICVVALGEL